MSEKTVDRRIRKTKATIRTALVSMLQHQHISSVSIKNLCDLADINRSTFYVHYADQHDLLMQIEREVLEDLTGYLKTQDFNYSKPISVQLLTSILEYIKANAELFKALLSENCDLSIQQDIMELAQIVSFKAYQEVESRTAHYMKIFAINGCIAVLHGWLQDGLKESPSKIAALLSQIMYEGMNGVKN